MKCEDTQFPIWRLKMKCYLIILYDASRFFHDAVRFFCDALRFFCDASRHQL